jgi:hypothetical protein
MSKTHTYYAIGYDYQRPTEWFAGSQKEAFNAFVTESNDEDKNKMRVRVVVETYVVDDNDKLQHACERGCQYHLVDKTTWIHTNWGPPEWFRKIASRLS